MKTIQDQIVLFDIDDTLSITSYKWMEYTARFMMAQGYPRVGGLARYGFERSFDIPEKDMPAYRRFMTNNFPYLELEVVPGMDRLVQYLIKEKVHVCFVTNRQKEHLQDTKKWLAEKLGVENPKIYLTSNDKVERLLATMPCNYLVDNSLKRCEVAKKYGYTSILFNGVGVDSTDCATPSSLLKEVLVAKSAAEIVDFFNEEVRKGKEEKRMDTIEIGDTVTVSENVFTKLPYLPRELMHKPLTVIDLYRDPKTQKLLRVSVTCDGVDNPKSKYNCFYLPGYQVTLCRKAQKITPKEFVNTKVEEAARKDKHYYYIDIRAGSGVHQIVQVIFKNGETIPDAYDLVFVSSTQDSREFLVARQNIFEEKTELFNWIAGENDYV